MTPADVGLTPGEYRHLAASLGREPSDVELAIVGALWSEHCSYKSSKQALRWLAPDPALAQRLAAGPGDNAGAIRFSDRREIVFKVESHNHPSFVEPFSGAATGVGGIIRDVLAMGAEPICLLDSLRFGTGPERPRVESGVVSGIAAYGNAIGVPTVGGEVAYGPGYEQNPLVNVMCVGQRAPSAAVNASGAHVGDHLLLLGAATGRDGIGGASRLASRALDPSEADQRPMVQVGDPLTGKLLVEAVLAALATGRVHAVQDLGASGLSSAVAELASQSRVGVVLDVNQVGLREPALTPGEIMLSESQERMLLAVAPADIEAVAAVAGQWELPLWDVGRATADGLLVVQAGGRALASLPVPLLTDGVPLREAVRPERAAGRRGEPVSVPRGTAEELREMWRQIMRHPDVASHAHVYRQYDSMVKAATVVGPGADAAVLRLDGEEAGLAVVVDGPARWAAGDAWTGGERAVLEAVANLVVVGAEPLGLSDGINAGSPDDPATYRQLLELVAGVAEGAQALAVPVTGGNVSLYNQTRTADGRVESIWPTAIIGAVGRHPHPDRVTPMALPGPDVELWRLGAAVGDLGASVWRLAAGDGQVGVAAAPDWPLARRVMSVVAVGIAAGWILAAHDVSGGGTAAAVAEMWLASPHPDLAVQLSLGEVPPGGWVPWWFGEDPGVVVVAVRPADAPRLAVRLTEMQVPGRAIGCVEASGARLQCDLGVEGAASWDRSELMRLWRGLDPEMAAGEPGAGSGGGGHGAVE